MEFHSASAVVPVYNGGSTLAHCLASLRLQGPELKEVIVVDDGSSDASRGIISDFVAVDPRFVLVVHARNEGLARSLNDGIARTSGDAVLVLHTDSRLVGNDWVARGLALLAEHPRVIATGSPIYPFRELNAVELAFGLLRDTFYRARTSEEDLGFSEFKCDLFPREAVELAAFDERFRSSGEDQVQSVLLTDAGYRIVRFSELEYEQRFGRASTLASQLRKEVAYGRAEGGILVHTALRVARLSTRSTATARRLANRAAAVLFAVGLASCVLLLLTAGSPWPAVLALPLLVPRVLIVLARTRFFQFRHELSVAGRALPLAILPVADILYAASVFSGALHFGALRRV